MDSTIAEHDKFLAALKTHKELTGLLTKAALDRIATSQQAASDASQQATHAVQASIAATRAVSAANNAAISAVSDLDIDNSNITIISAQTALAQANTGATTAQANSYSAAAQVVADIVAAQAALSAEGDAHAALSAGVVAVTKVSVGDNIADYSVTQNAVVKTVSDLTLADDDAAAVEITNRAETDTDYFTQLSATLTNDMAVACTSAASIAKRVVTQAIAVIQAINTAALITVYTVDPDAAQIAIAATSLTSEVITAIQIVAAAITTEDIQQIHNAIASDVEAMIAAIVTEHLVGTAASILINTADIFSTFAADASAVLANLTVDDEAAMSIQAAGAAAAPITVFTKSLTTTNIKLTGLCADYITIESIRAAQAPIISTEAVAADTTDAQAEEVAGTDIVAAEAEDVVATEAAAAVSAEKVTGVDVVATVAAEAEDVVATEAAAAVSAEKVASTDIVASEAEDVVVVTAPTTAAADNVSEGDADHGPSHHMAYDDYVEYLGADGPDHQGEM